MAKTMGTQKRRLTQAELAAKQDELEQAMRRELAPLEAKYWEAVRETNLLYEELKHFFEPYQAMWNEKVVPHRKDINNIYRKYRRRLNKLTQGNADS